MAMSIPVLHLNYQAYVRWLSENHKNPAQFAYVASIESLRHFPTTRTVLASRLSDALVRQKATERGYTFEFID